MGNTTSSIQIQIPFSADSYFKISVGGGSILGGYAFLAESKDKAMQAYSKVLKIKDLDKNINDYIDDVLKNPTISTNNVCKADVNIALIGTINSNVTINGYISSIIDATNIDSTKGVMIVKVKDSGGADVTAENTNNEGIPIFTDVADNNYKIVTNTIEPTISAITTAKNNASAAGKNLYIYVIYIVSGGFCPG